MSLFLHSCPYIHVLPPQFVGNAVFNIESILTQLSLYTSPQFVGNAVYCLVFSSASGANCSKIYCTNSDANLCKFVIQTCAQSSCVLIGARNMDKKKTCTKRHVRHVSFLVYVSQACVRVIRLASSPGAIFPSLRLYHIRVTSSLSMHVHGYLFPRIFFFCLGHRLNVTEFNLLVYSKFGKTFKYEKC